MKVTDEDLTNMFQLANRPNLTTNEYQETKEYLLKVLSETSLGASSKYSVRINSALSALEHHKPVVFDWWQKPLGLISISTFSATLGGVLTYKLLITFGWVVAG